MDMFGGEIGRVKKKSDNQQVKQEKGISKRNSENTRQKQKEINTKQ